MQRKKRSKHPGDSGWRELIGKKREFQEILRVLLDYEERTAGFAMVSSTHLHLVRKALAICPARDLRIFLLDRGAAVFSVIMEGRFQSTCLVTAYIHEDGIRAERIARRDRLEHPVHTMTCLSDLFEKNTRALTEAALAKRAPVAASLDLMLDPRFQPDSRSSESEAQKRATGT